MEGAVVDCSCCSVFAVVGIDCVVEVEVEVVGTHLPDIGAVVDYTVAVAVAVEEADLHCSMVVVVVHL